ncbi:MAG: HNH endonuclease, partial [Altibacter sp.]|nr:HNH endonuclease [Altibacter sp.]
MKEPQLEYYTHLLLALNRGYNKGFGRAPHKPILLLAVLEQIHKGNYTTNKIFVTPELVLSFKNLFNRLVDTGHKDTISLPFFHMRSEPFWRLVIKPGFELSVTSSKSIKSFKSLVESVAFAEIDRDLFFLASDPIDNALLRTILLDHYFPKTKDELQYSTAHTLENTIEKQILNESTTEYQTRLDSLKHSLQEDELAEELFIRGGVFKTTIPKTYDHTCCISGMKITNAQKSQMVDACHIIPFSISYNDTVP